MDKTNSKQNWEDIKKRIDGAKASMKIRKTLPGYKIAEILRNRAESIANANKVVTIDEELVNIIEFELGKETYAIETLYLKEVTSSEKIYDLPCTPNYIFGVINLRGKIVTIIDLKKYLKLNYKGINDLTSIIIVEFNETLVGFVADKIIGIKNISRGNIQKTKPKLQNIKESFLIGITGETVIILDIIELLEDKSILIEDSVI